MTVSIAQQTREWTAEQLAAIEALAQSGPDGIALIASYGPGPLRAAILGLHAELRSRGHVHPALPPLPPAPDCGEALAELRQAASAAATELGAIDSPSARV